MKKIILITILFLTTACVPTYQEKPQITIDSEKLEQRIESTIADHKLRDFFEGRLFR